MGTTAYDRMVARTITGEAMQQVNTWLTPETVRRLEERAGEMQQTRSSYIRALLLQALNRMDREGQ